MGSSPSVAPTTWAALARDSKESGMVSPPIKNTLGRTVLVNALNYRVDEQVPRPSQSAMISWNHKIKRVGMRYCRSFHFHNNCQGDCVFSHAPLSDQEKLVFRADLRREPCHTGLECRDPHCYYGHSCSCKSPNCKFPPEMHGVDSLTAVVWKK